MSDAAETDMAANAWPGFVDILSAVVIMFVFFVLIIAAVLYFYTITYKAKVEGTLTAEISKTFMEAEVREIMELKRENTELRNEIKTKETKISQGGGKAVVETKNESQAAQTFGVQSEEQKVMESEETQSIVLFHDPGAITVDEDTEAKIAEFIDKMSNKHGYENIEIVLTSPKTENSATQSRAKRLAVARMLNVRNSLLESEVEKTNINLSVVENEQVEESDNWTRVQINILP